MSTEEDKMKQQWEEAGIDISDLKEEPKQEEPKVEEPAPKKEEEPKPEAKEDEPLKDDKEPRKRSIYDEYKDKKSELKEERALREAAERQRDELQAKLDAASKATNREDRKEALDDVQEFISKHKEWNEPAIREFINLARKGYEAKIPDELAKDLADFKAWKTQNSAAIEKQMFEQEFTAATPRLQKMFPGAQAEEMSAIKAELDKLSHTKEWHDKPLAFIAFENQDALGALVSPKKKGMERKGRNDIEDTTFDFDPNADISKMSEADREKWWKTYNDAAKQETMTDSRGRKILV